MSARVTLAIVCMAACVAAPAAAQDLGPDPLGRDCSEMWTTPLGEFRISDGGANWFFDFGDHVALQMAQSLGALGEVLTPGMPFRQSELFIDFAWKGDRTRLPGGANAIVHGRTLHVEAAEITAGDHVQHFWLLNGSGFFIDGAVAKYMLEGTGAITFRAYHVERGTLVLKTLPAGTLSAAIAELRAGRARFIERRSDPDRLCRHYEPGPPIVTVD